MSKVGQWVFEMQEDATWMSKAVFVNVHGITNASVWEEVQRQMSGLDYEPDWEGMSQGAME